MSNQLQTNLDAILQDKNTNLKPENLKQGVTCLGVEGTAETGGIDTSDANATANNLDSGKTAYANGEKITGNVTAISDEWHNFPETEDIVNDTGLQTVAMTKQLPSGNSIHILGGAKVTLSCSQYQMSQAIGLTADKIKAGETILGITGTYTGEPEASL